MPTRGHPRPGCRNLFIVDRDNGDNADNGDQDEFSEALEGFRESYVAGCPFRQDRDLVDLISEEARPVIEALGVGLVDGPGGDPELTEHHEALAMVTLLGRRAGALGVTPTAAMAIAGAMGAGLARIGLAVSEKLGVALATLSVEGYVAGREDALREQHAAASVESVVTLAIVPRVFALVLSGDHEPEALAEIVERFGRRLLKGDAVAAIVDISGLREATEEGAVEVFAAHSTARMLGVTCLFVGVTDPWLEAAKTRRVDLDLVRIEDTFEDALRAALPLSGWKLESTSWLPGPLKRVLKRG